MSKKDMFKLGAAFFVVLFLVTTASVNAYKTSYMESQSGQQLKITYQTPDEPDDPEDEIEKVLSFSFPSPMISDVIINSTTYHQVTIDGLPTIGDAGFPVLPVKPVNILLPQRGEVVSIDVSYDGMVSLGDGFDVELGPECAVLEGGEQNASNVSFDPTVPYPTELFNTIGMQHFRGYAILSVNLFPVQYIGETGEILFYEEMTLTITTTETGSANPFFRGLPEDELLLKQKVDDYSYLDTYSTYPPSISQPVTLVDPSETYDYVIVTNNALKNSMFQDLMNYKNERGIRTTIVTVEDIFACDEYDWGGFYGDKHWFFDEDQCKIRNFIKDAYLNWKIEYVLLGGDDDVIEHRGLYGNVIEAGGEPDDDIPADLYFACLDGNFNNVKDTKWGWIGDKTDLIAEVHVGRASVSNAVEVENFVTKTLTYIETADFYLEDVLMAGENLNENTWGSYYMDELIDGSDNYGYSTVGIPSDKYTIDTLYDRDGSWPKSEIINKINNNIHLINHLGHAGQDYNMKMSNSDVDALTNDKPCFIYSQGCYSGAFDNYWDCVAEHFTVKTIHGAFAGIWNSRYGIFANSSTNGPNQWYHRKFLDAIYGESQDDFKMREIGRAHTYSREENIYRMDYTSLWGRATRWCYYTITLFGDPQLAIKPAEVPDCNLLVNNIHRPRFVLPGEQFTVDAFILNNGLYDEINVQVNLKVDGVLVDTTIIDYISENTAEKVSFNLSLEHGMRDVTVEIMPIGGEDITDNVMTKQVISSHPPEKPTKPWGSTQGEAWKWYTYHTDTIDIDDDDVYYLWHWGSISDILEWFGIEWWRGPCNSGETASATHMWLDEGNYSIKVIAKDIFGRFSEWSDPLPVSMPVVFPNMKNVADQIATWIGDSPQIDMSDGSSVYIEVV